MRESKMNVRLTASPWMDARGGAENGRIRIPKRARLAFDVSAGRVTIKTSSYEVGLEVRLARREDVIALQEQVSAGKVTEDQANMTVFVTSTTRDKLLGKNRRKNKEEGLYITDRIDALKIGADPEFALVDPATKRFKYAAQVPGLTLQGALGQDGPLAELRPAPATNPKKLVDTIQKILTQNRSKIEQYDWIGGAVYKNSAYPQDRFVSMGGHIHIGDPPVITDKKVAVYKRIIQMLDETLAIPLVRVDTPEPYIRRNEMYQGHGRYGRWGDQRPQEGRFEWRVPSGFWSAHPHFAMAVLGATKALSEECYQRMVDQNFDVKYVNAPRTEDGFLKEWDAIPEDKAEKLVNDSNPDAIPAKLVDKMASRLKSLSNYETYKEEIDAFVDLVKISPKDRSNLSLDLKKNWLEGAHFINK